MRHAVSSKLYAYWRVLSRGACPPERNEIDPGMIRDVLADTFVLEFNPTVGFPFRIAGSKVSAVFMEHLRGSSFLHIWRDEDGPRIVSILQTAADEELPYVLLAEARPAGIAPVEIEVTLLPLRHQEATYARMLGSLAAGIDGGWLGRTASGVLALKLHRPVFGAETINREADDRHADAAGVCSCLGSFAQLAPAAD